MIHVQSAGVRFTSGSGMYYGAVASLDVFQLKGLLNNQASGSQIILTKGEKGPKNLLNAVHAGYHVSRRNAACDRSSISNLI